MKPYILEEPILEPIEDFIVENSAVGFKRVTLVEKPLAYSFERRGDLSKQTFRDIQQKAIQKIAEYLLNTMKYSCIEEYDDYYVHTFKQDILIEKGLNEFITKISELEIHNENLRDKNTNLKYSNNRLKIKLFNLETKVEEFNKSNFWKRLKYLFKGEL